MSVYDTTCVSMRENTIEGIVHPGTYLCPKGSIGSLYTPKYVALM